MIYWTKKIIKKNSFQEISKDFIKNDFWINDFNLFIYKKRKKKESIYFLNFICIQFSKKNYLHLLYQNNLLQNFNSGTKIIFTCFY